MELTQLTQLNETLKSKAIELNACYKGISQMDKMLSVDELITLWKHFFDFAIDNDFPSNSFIKENFDKETLRKNNVYVDEQVAIHNQNGIVVINGESYGTAMYDGFSCATIYVRHDSNITISTKGFSKIFVHCYDDSKVDVNQDEDSRVYLYMHGNSTQMHSGNVVIRQK